MAGAFPPGLGNDQQATQATAAMRQSPWYVQWLKAQGITPGEGDQVKLNDNQRAQLMSLAIKNGIGFNDKYDMIDENGQIAEEHHKLKKVAIAAALAGLAVTGLGAAGVGPLAGALGGTTIAAPAVTTAATTAAAPAAAVAGGVLPSTVIGSGFIPAIAGSAGAGSSIAALTAAAGAGAGAEAGGGGAAAAGVSKWLTPALQYGAPVAGQLIGAGMQASANRDAAELKAQGIKDALDFEKAQYGDLTKRLDPYVQSGGASADRMAQLLGLPQRAGTTATAPPTRGPALAPNGFAPPAPAVALPQAGAAPAPDALVTLVAPDGSQKQVPQSHAAFFISRGAKPVQAAA